MLCNASICSVGVQVTDRIIVFYAHLLYILFITVHFIYPAYQRVNFCRNCNYDFMLHSIALFQVEWNAVLDSVRCLFFFRFRIRLAGDKDVISQRLWLAKQADRRFLSVPHLVSGRAHKSSSVQALTESSSRTAVPMSLKPDVESDPLQDN